MHVLRIALVTWHALWVLGCFRSEPKAPPNVVLIVVDTLRADHVGTYGERSGLTPSLDALAERGLVYEHAIATSSWTRSSVASILTSRYPSAIGVLGRDDLVAESVDMLAEVLGRSGYATAAVSTNNNAGMPFGFAQGFDRFETPELRAGYPGDYQIHIAEGVNDRALEMIDALDGDRPFFLFLHYVDPHDPYLEHPGMLETPMPEGRFDGSRPALRAAARLGLDRLTEADIARLLYLYAGEVRYVDHWIGRLVEDLGQRQLLQNTWLVVTADHGEGLWDHGHRAHGTDLFEEAVRVPLIVVPPANAAIKRPQRIAQRVSLIDIAPTLTAVAGVERPAIFDGIDLLSTAAGEGRELRRQALVFSELTLDGHEIDAAYHHQHKLIVDRDAVGQPSQLFDLAADPDELSDAGTRVLDRRQEMEELLGSWRRQMSQQSSAIQATEAPALDAETLRQLQALGYIDDAGRPALPGDAPPETP